MFIKETAKHEKQIIRCEENEYGCGEPDNLNKTERCGIPGTLPGSMFLLRG